ncbi:MAG: histidine phosphatase family protein [Phycisphaerales bacterium]
MAEPIPLILQLIRTGNCLWETQGRFAGLSNIPLCPSSEPNLREIGAGLRVDTRVILSAEDDASIAAARIVGESCPNRVDQKAIEELHEIGLGLWEGMLEADAQSRFHSMYRQWKTDPASVALPEAETLSDARERLLAAIGRGAGRAGSKGSVAVVLRPLAWATAACALGDIPTVQFWDLLKAPESNLTISIDPAVLKVKRRAARTVA